MTKKSGSDIRLSRLELQIMNVVWEKGKATVHDVKKALGRGRKPAYSTILTTMRIIETKGYLEHDVDNRTYVYRPTISQAEVRQGVLADVIDRLFDGSPALLMDSLVGKEQISRDELHKIQRVIEEAARDG